MVSTCHHIGKLAGCVPTFFTHSLLPNSSIEYLLLPPKSYKTLTRFVRERHHTASSQDTSVSHWNGRNMLRLGVVESDALTDL